MRLVQAVLLSLLIIPAYVFAAGGERYFTAVPKSGDSKYELLQRYHLPLTIENKKLFLSLNPHKFTKSGGLMTGIKYKLPLKIVNVSKNLSKSLGVKNKDLVKKLEQYNNNLYKEGLITQSYKKSGEFLIPVNALEKNAVRDENSGTNSYPIFGDKYSKVKQLDDELEGYVYYLDSGHGGPDPGAIGYCGDKQLHEDEYAYDITLRLARKLLEHGARVYIIVRDTNDGIRDDEYLKNSSDEYYLGGYRISENQHTRLQKRADIINKLYHENKKTAISQQSITIHLDSRVTDQKLDIFFYYKPGSESGRNLAEALSHTIKTKYDINRPNRAYSGSVSERDLFMLRETKPTAIYIELGNIQNPSDQKRFIQKNNRQAVANWLCEGLLNAAKED